MHQGDTDGMMNNIEVWKSSLIWVCTVAVGPVVQSIVSLMRSLKVHSLSGLQLSNQVHVY